MNEPNASLTLLPLSTGFWFEPKLPARHTPDKKIEKIIKNLINYIFSKIKKVGLKLSERG